METKETPKQEAKPEPKPEAKTQEPKKVAPAGNAGKIAAILIRNTTGASGAIRDTLKMLNLNSKLTCSIIENNSCMKGMLKKVKDYVTYGEVDGETLKLLEQKRGKKDKEGKMKLQFNLHPPRGGFERKGIKRSYVQGGALGYRGGKITELIKKML